MIAGPKTAGPGGRWTVLAMLFLTRAVMAFQFQSVAAVNPQIGREFAASLADVGILIGLYFAPGAALALPGNRLARRRGDKSTVIGGLVLMLAGELLMAASTSWSMQLVGRVVSGVGGILVNVLATKMLAEWFSGREIATAMAIFVSSWPVGIALALVLLSPVGAAFGVRAANLAVAGAVVVALALFAATYRATDKQRAGTGDLESLNSRTAYAVVAAGTIWCLYNVGFAMIFSFGPSLLVERGWSSPAAASTISVVLWLTVLSVPVGGALTDRIGRGGAMVTGGCIAFSLLMLALARTELVLATVIALGLVCGLPAGAIMALPTQVLQDRTRSVGMGLFYTVYYAGMLAAPAIGGKLSTITSSAGAGLEFGAVSLLVCPALLWLFARIAAVPSPAAGASS